MSKEINVEQTFEIIKELLTDEHKELIRKKITKAIKEIDFKRIMEDFIQGEFEYVSDSCEVADYIRDEVNEVIRCHLIKSGLLKDKEQINR